ncbi:hypothetical protein FKN04_12955 [Bacillus glycinifermentans]|uniref:hypothetical protein n=1 Tax=Bacillus glycinifermentans TaxID=1664069 RepID=UPI001581A07C|nr:hypothetical protein [Bacillus glycinifermentans]NUJ17485.1 hypothetical protein [Bacillus glycinifermentans]
MDKKLQRYFKKLDEKLSELGQSDSSVEYAPHVREPFDKVVESLNEIRTYLGGYPIKVNRYFNIEDE